MAKLNADGSALVFSTYLGGSDFDDSYGIAVDAAGNIYLTGGTASIDFPLVNPYQSTPPSTFIDHAFVMKLDATGATILYSTFLGGSGGDRGSAIALDIAGNIYVTGRTYSSDFPTVNPLQGAFAGEDDLFIAKFDPTGSALIFSSYLGGSEEDIVRDMAVDPAGKVYLTGYTYSTDLPTINSLQPMPIDTADFTGNAFVIAVDTANPGLIFSTYIGGDGDDEGWGIAIDAAGGIYVVGGTASADFITTPGAFQSELGNPPDYYKMDCFIGKILQQ